MLLAFRFRHLYFKSLNNPTETSLNGGDYFFSTYEGVCTFAGDAFTLNLQDSRLGAKRLIYERLINRGPCFREQCPPSRRCRRRHKSRLSSPIAPDFELLHPGVTGSALARSISGVIFFRSFPAKQSGSTSIIVVNVRSLSENIFHLFTPSKKSVSGETVLLSINLTFRFWITFMKTGPPASEDL